MSTQAATLEVTRTLRRVLLLATTCGLGCEGTTPAHAERSQAPSPSPPITTPAGKCGATGLPECPTQRWMKATLQTYLRTRDGARLARALDALAEAAPEGYSDWQEISHRAAQAARTGDLDAVKAQCATCHDQHRKRFRKERRAVPLALHRD